MSHITNTVSQILSNRKFRSELNEQPFKGQDKGHSTATSSIIKLAIMFPAIVMVGAVLMENMLVWVKG